MHSIFSACHRKLFKRQALSTPFGIWINWVVYPLPKARTKPPDRTLIRQAITASLKRSTFESLLRRYCAQVYRTDHPRTQGPVATVGVLFQLEASS